MSAPEIAVKIRLDSTQFAVGLKNALSQTQAAQSKMAAGLGFGGRGVSAARSTWQAGAMNGLSLPAMTASSSRAMFKPLADALKQGTRSMQTSLFGRPNDSARVRIFNAAEDLAGTLKEAFGNPIRLGGSLIRSTVGGIAAMGGAVARGAAGVGGRVAGAGANLVRGGLNLAGNAAMVGVAGAGLAVGGAFLAGGAGLAKSSSSAAEMETYQSQFETLLGNKKAAQSRMDELAIFARETPFDLAGITRASRQLEVLTKGALSTGKGLEMVGNVAAMTGGEFDNISMWIGRLYDSLQSGRPFGEAMMRLQELGAISGADRTRIEELAAGTKKAGTAINKDFGGSISAAQQKLGRFLKMAKGNGELTNIIDLARNSLGNLRGQGYSEENSATAQEAVGGAIDAIKSAGLGGSGIGKALLADLEKIASGYDDLNGKAKKLGAANKEAGAAAWAAAETAFGRFGGAMDRLSGTFDGMIANLKESFDFVFREVGKPLNEALKPVLKDLMAWADSARPAFSELGNTLGGAVNMLRDLVGTGNLGKYLQETFQIALMKVSAVGMGVIQVLTKFLGDSLAAVATGEGAATLANFITGLGILLGNAITEGLSAPIKAAQAKIDSFLSGGDSGWTVKAGTALDLMKGLNPGTKIAEAFGFGGVSAQEYTAAVRQQYRSTGLTEEERQKARMAAPLEIFGVTGKDQHAVAMDLITKGAQGLPNLAGSLNNAAASAIGSYGTSPAFDPAMAFAEQRRQAVISSARSQAESQRAQPQTSQDDSKLVMTTNDLLKQVIGLMETQQVRPK